MLEYAFDSSNYICYMLLFRKYLSFFVCGHKLSQSYIFFGGDGGG